MVNTIIAHVLKEKDIAICIILHASILDNRITNEIQLLAVLLNSLIISLHPLRFPSADTSLHPLVITICDV